MNTRKAKATKPAPAVEKIAEDAAPVDGVASTTVADGEAAPAVSAEPEPADDMPRWMKYRIEHGLPIEDASAGDE